MQSFRYDTIDSTNEEAKRLIAAGRIAGCALLTAGEQTRGKGTHGRSWVSPKDAGIYLTVVQTTDLQALAATVYSLTAGVACAEVLADLVGLDVRLKPVNDLVLDGRKLGGILIETIIHGGRMTALITGVGINVRVAERRVPAEAMPPVCLQEVLPPERFGWLDIDALTEALAERIVEWNSVVGSGNLDRVRVEWLQHGVPGATLPQ